MNFEPCNPPLMDPLYLSGVTLRTDLFKPITLSQQDLKIRLFPEKSSPIRPVPVRPHSSTNPNPSPQTTSPTLNSCSTYTSHNLTNVTTSSPLSCYRPVSNKVTSSQSPGISPQFDIITDISRAKSVQSHTAPANSPVQTNTAPGNFRKISPVQSTITSAFSRNIPHAQSYTTPANSRKMSPVQSYTTPANSRKISPVQYLKKSPRSTPYSPKSSPDSTPVANKSDKRKNERHEISEFQSNILKKWFNSYTYLTSETRTEVSKDTGLPERTVMYWFQNQRRKVKRETSVKS